MDSRPWFNESESKLDQSTEIMYQARENNSTKDPFVFEETHSTIPHYSSKNLKDRFSIHVTATKLFLTIEIYFSDITIF